MAVKERSSAYGDLLREARRSAGKTLKDVADLLGVSIVYVSDVERQNRPPFSPDRTRRIADFLRTDPTPLLIASFQKRGVFEVDLSSAGPSQLAAISGMARGGVTEHQWEKIAEILRGDDE